MQCRTLPPLHGHAAPGPGLFFFMIVWLMAKSNPQLLELLHLLAVDVQPRLCSHGSRIVLEDIAHVKVHSRCDVIVVSTAMPVRCYSRDAPREAALRCTSDSRPFAAPVSSIPPVSG